MFRMLIIAIAFIAFARAEVDDAAITKDAANTDDAANKDDAAITDDYPIASEDDADDDVSNDALLINDKNFGADDYCGWGPAGRRRGGCDYGSGDCDDDNQCNTFDYKWGAPITNHAKAGVGRCGPHWDADCVGSRKHPMGKRWPTASPCCNPVSGWCGASDAHCKCDGCIDFRKEDFEGRKTKCGNRNCLKMSINTIGPTSEWRKRKLGWEDDCCE